MPPSALKVMRPGIIYCEASVGSNEFSKLLKDNHGLRTSVESFRSADFAFCCGHTKPNPFCDGEYGCRIGIERKTLSDLIGSLMKGRLNRKQIPEMLADYDLCWILIEAEYRPAHDDAIETVTWRKQSENKPNIEITAWNPQRSALTYSQLSSWLARYDVMGKGRIKRWRTRNQNETAAFVFSLWRWWQKEWSKHQLESVEKMPAPTKAMLWKANAFERNAASLDLIGIQKMKKITRHFTSIYQMINASPSQWQRAGLSEKESVAVFAAIRKEYR